jgi:uncharacterized protein
MTERSAHGLGEHMSRHSLEWYFILAYVLSWSIEIPLALSVRGLIAWRLPPWIHYLAAFGPFAAAITVTGLSQGAAGVNALLKRLIQWRVPVRYYAAAIAAPVLLFGLAVVVERLVRGAWPPLVLLGEADYLPYIGPVAALGLWMLTYGLGEETGWRGFALPRLQASRTAASATLILWALWVGWHVPAFFYRDTYVAMGALGFPMFAFSLLFAAMLFTWLYNSSRGSVLIVMVFHGMFNWLSVSSADGGFAPMIMTVPVIIWALLIPRLYGVENLSPLGRQTA